jgi:hypothetical protein
MAFNYIRCTRRSFDCDTDYCLVAAKFRERLSASKQFGQKSDIERFTLKKVEKVKDKEEY